ncbi:hypothetical protein BJ878DRAFT_415808 [Calycina marina]|uniref:Vacuolar ATPase assembly protein VMA22 n=1 Tax=Calycina marina TaxID=1763456 RepID=A0A9P7Z7T5_9HELO|nr:hypothetical protein BJ878DRAFT_415808 [Calycina marina]
MTADSSIKADRPQETSDSIKSASPEKISEDIDNLLLRYLALIDQYTTLRTELSTSQASFYQSLSRANFTADRGISTYGADRYALNMQATRLLTISDSTSPAGNVDLEAEVTKAETGSAEKIIQPDSGDTIAPASMIVTPELKFEITKKKVEGIKDPIKMFAALPPQNLRTAQKEAVGWLVLVARLVEIDREMVEVEIGVRRGRKYLKKSKGQSADGTREKVEEMMEKATIQDGESKSSEAIDV